MLGSVYRFCIGIMPKKSKHLVVSYDAGTSLSKILYQLGSGTVKYLTMEPEVMTLPASSASSLPNSSGLGKPEDNAWVRLHLEGECFVTGKVARNYRATVSIKRLKHESLVPKILAALGAIATKEGLDQFNLDLAVLIPFGEYSSRDELEKELRSAVETFYFQNRQCQVKLQRYNCIAEAGGLVFSYIHRNGLCKFQNQTLVYLMFGYRNTSLLLFREGTLSQTESSTTQLGFYDFIDKFTHKVPGISREEVQAAIITLSKGYHNLERAQREYEQVTHISVNDLIKSKNTEKAELQKIKIQAALETATQEYWQLLTQWLYEILPPLNQLNGVIYCGGASHLFLSQICTYFDNNQSILYLTNSEEKQLLKALELNEYEQKNFKIQNLAVRFVDVWGVFVKFAGYKISPNEKAA